MYHLYIGASFLEELNSHMTTGAVAPEVEIAHVQLQFWVQLRLVTITNDYDDNDK